MRFISLLSLGTVLLSATSSFVSAECCGVCPPSSQCGDGTHCDRAVSCCANGECNIFCCNCDDGCRPGSEFLKLNLRSMKHVEAPDCHATITSHDLNKDGKITFLEWATSVSMTEIPLSKLAGRWLQYDTEGKGYLTIEEATNRRF